MCRLKKVSIIVLPAPSDAGDIIECLKSIRSQANAIFEIVIACDSFSSEELSRLRAHKNYNRSVRISIERNIRDLILQNTNGDYLMFLTADTQIEPHTLEMALDRIGLTESDFVIFDWKYSHASRKSVYLNENGFFGQHYLEGDDRKKLLEIKFPHLDGSKLYSREFLLKNIKDETISASKCSDAWNKVVIEAKRIGLLHAPLLNIRIKESVDDKTLCKLKGPNQNLNRSTYKLMKSKSAVESHEDIILFMGFDYRYVGNSRYLFEDLLKVCDDNIYFATKSELVDDKFRIKPYSKVFFEAFYSAKVVIFESWVPLFLLKPKKAIWIQMWHGQPLKKLLFDSEEPEITTRRRDHKRHKYNDICRWDYLLIDGEGSRNYFERSFMLPSNKVLSFGYPRVQYLFSKKYDLDHRRAVRRMLNISSGTKVVLYLSTWRDYNYGKVQDERDFSYLLEVSSLQEDLGDGYTVISREHAILGSNSENLLTELEVDTQDLLLAADYLVTDYSSVMFDAFAIDLPVVLFANDFDKYAKSRGVYEDIWTDLLPFVCSDESDVASMIRGYKLDTNYRQVAQRFKSAGKQKEFIKFILSQSNKRKHKQNRSAKCYLRCVFKIFPRPVKSWLKGARALFTAG